MVSATVRSPQGVSEDPADFQWRVHYQAVVTTQSPVAPTCTRCVPSVCLSVCRYGPCVTLHWPLRSRGPEIHEWGHSGVWDQIECPGSPDRFTCSPFRPTACVVTVSTAHLHPCALSEVYVLRAWWMPMAEPNFKGLALLATLRTAHERLQQCFMAAKAWPDLNS